MDIGEVDKETIIESSSDTESNDQKRSRSRSKEIDIKKRKRRNSTDSRSSSGHHKVKRTNRFEKYDKYKDKHKKDKDSDKRERDRKNKVRSRTKSKNRDRRRSRTRSPYSKDEKNKSRRKNRSKSSELEKKSAKSQDRNSSNFELKKKFDEFYKTTDLNAPISTSDPSKRDRELYVANLPEGLSPANVMDLMNAAMVAIGANVKSGNPLVSSWLSSDSNIAFLEFRTPEEANNAFKLDNINLLGKEIKIGRPRYQDEMTQEVETIPNNYSKDMFPTLTSFEKDLSNPFINRTPTTTTTTSMTKQAAGQSPANMPAQSKLLVSNLPIKFNQDSVYKFFRTFGKIKSLEMIKDPITGHCSGQCHVEYETEAATANALHYAMGINLQGNILYLKRSSGLVPIYSVSSSIGPNSSLGILTTGGTSYTSSSQYISADEYVKLRESTPSKVICIKNMCTYKELEDDDEYDDLYDDVMEECKNYAKVISVKIPRPEIGESVQGIGKVCVEYFTRDGAAFAKEHLNGKSFHGRIVEVVYHPEDMFRKNQLD